MKHQVERLVGKSAEVTHIALNDLQLQSLALRNIDILPQLRLRRIEYGDGGPRRREQWSLLPTAGREAQHIGPVYGVEPVCGHPLLGSE